MHAGLIPVVSLETSVDVDPDFGLILDDCSIEQIKKSIKKISAISVQELKRMALKAWEFARANHTRETFAKEYRKAISAIMTSHSNKDRPLGKTIAAHYPKQAAGVFCAPASDDPS